MRLPLVPRLALAYLAARRARTIIAVAAIMAAVCLVVWVVSGYEALLKSHDEFAGRALGRYQLSVDPISRAAERHVPQAVVDNLRADLAVTAADPMWAEKVSLPMLRRQQPQQPQQPPDGRRRSRTHHMADEVMVLGVDAPAAPFEMRSGVWMTDFQPSQPYDTRTVAACLNVQVAQRLGMSLGDTFELSAGGGQFQINIVGIVDNPPDTVTGVRVGSMLLPSPSIAGIYVKMDDAERIHGRTRRITFVGVSLAEGVDIHDFRYSWAPRLAAGENPQQFQIDKDLEESLDEAETARNVAMQAYLVTAVSMLLAFLLVFITLNIGVTERVRQFGLLRTVALTRRQVAGIIMIEGALLAALGLVFGLLLAGLLLKFSGPVTTGGLFSHGTELGTLSATLAAVSVMAAALLAAVLPARRATAVRPLDALSPQLSQNPTQKKLSFWILVPALMLIAADPLLSMTLAPRSDGQAVLLMVAGMISIALGCLLLAPVAVIVVDRLITPVIEKAMALNSGLLRRQLVSHLYRNAGAAMALTVGLGLLLAIQTWGFSMLSAFVPGDWAPNAVVACGTRGASAEMMAAIDKLDGLASMPVVVEQPRLRRDITGSAYRASIIRQDNVVMVGLDARKAFTGERPLLPVEWIDGSADSAASRMDAGRACVVPDHFLRETGLSLGDSFEVVPPEKASSPAAYTIVGAVRLTGWHWMTKETQMRGRAHRTAALVFADYDSVAHDFNLHRPTHLMLRYSDASADHAAIEQDISEAIADCEPTTVNVQPEDGDDADDDAAPALITISHTRGRVLHSARRWIWAASIMPLIIVLIACLGLLNLIMASVRTRFWELGVLRAIGFTRWTIVRTIVAEGLLIGIVAWLLSLVFGLIAGWSATGAASRLSFFGGLTPRLVAPLPAIFAGGLIMLVFAGLAAAWPAVNAGRKRPLDLLSDGTGAF